MTGKSTNTFAGIDFGTSNSSVGLCRYDTPSLVNFPGEGNSVPSAIYYSNETAEVAFGKNAISAYTQDNEGRLLRSLKSVLGTALMGEKTVIRNRRVAFTDIMKDFFGYLKQHLDVQAQQDVDTVVLGRPVHFVDDDEDRDREAENQLRQIAHSAGFTHIEFQYEPIAAALNYESTLQREELVAIVDIGGGTADFSVLRLSPQRHNHSRRNDDVLATTGIHIGGTDFDRLLSLDRVMPELGFGSAVRGTERLLPGSTYFDLATWHRIPLLYNITRLNQARQMRLDALESAKLDRLIAVIEHRLGHTLARSVEMAKIDLSDSDSAVVKLRDAKLALSCTVSAEDMRKAIAGSVEQLAQCLQQALLQAGVAHENIVSVFYTGGTSNVPYLRQSIRDLLPQAEHKQGDVFGSVGLGLAIDAARRFN